MKKFIVAALHGDETFGLKIIAQLHDKDVPLMATEIGNPSAIAAGRRYIETDLNRSFGASQKSFEARIATRIQNKVAGYNPDILIDIHTSISNIGKVGIVTQINTLLCYAAQEIGLEAIILMPKAIAQHSLIGAFSDIGLSIEYGKDNRSDELAAEIATRIAELRVPPASFKATIPIYEVFGTIPKNFPGLGAIVNLRYNRQLKGYPVLAGKGTYKDIGGFIASQVSTDKLS